MKNLEIRALDYIKKNNMITKGDNILIGVSGGADSVSLLMVLYALKETLDINLYVCHVNHGIRCDAGSDAQYVEKLCKERNIPFYLIEEDVPAIANEKKLTEEEAGRIVRYEAFKKNLDSVGGGKIAIAHNQNDVAETMLLNLFRGSGITGAVGIRPVRDNIIRPLLFASRTDIENYLKDLNISFCTDSTNLEDDHARNRIRHNILPYASSDINSRAVEHLYSSAESIQKAADFISVCADKALSECMREYSIKDTDSIELDIEIFNKNAAIVKETAILKVFEMLTPHRKDISKVHVMSVLDLIESRNGTKKIDLPYNLVAIRQYNKLFIRQNGTENQNNLKEIILDASKDCIIDIEGYGELSITHLECRMGQNIPDAQYTKWFDYDKIQTILKLRKRQTGDYMTLGDDQKKKSLKKFMIDEKIPASIRDDLYVLADGSHIVWVPGYRISSFYKISENTRNIIQINIQTWA